MQTFFLVLHNFLHSPTDICPDWHFPMRNNQEWLGYLLGRAAARWQQLGKAISCNVLSDMALDDRCQIVLIEKEKSNFSYQYQPSRRYKLSALHLGLSASIKNVITLCCPHGALLFSEQQSDVQTQVNGVRKKESWFECNRLWVFSGGFQSLERLEDNCISTTGLQKGLRELQNNF